MDFEEAVDKLVDEYGCPDSLADDIKDFLTGSGNVYGIIDLYNTDKVERRKVQDENN